jgi:hypothetical protein
MGNLFLHSLGLFGSVPPLLFYLTDNLLQSPLAAWIVFVFMFQTLRRRALCLFLLPFVVAFLVFTSTATTPRLIYFFLLGLEMKFLNPRDLIITFPARIWFTFTNILLSNVSKYFLDPGGFKFTFDPFYNLAPEISDMASPTKPIVSRAPVETLAMLASSQIAHRGSLTSAPEYRTKS